MVIMALKPFIPIILQRKVRPSIERLLTHNAEQERLKRFF
jgi:hypothetical protein